ncbi:hypothetical protein PaG_00592 [Moesziomyces aphidis]|jgi:FK506-binding protein 8|uniref:Uncharacterized protein n=1 Tax=Moesziomyces aphidis TaxID=84754 RepID=W3VV36_MOEAP|nr:hypothetical protein PaG_00592 [Moesziomyces aphidis]
MASASASASTSGSGSTSTPASGSGSAPGTASSHDSKLATGLSHKAAGNASFVSGDISAALSSYHHAVLYLSGLQTRSILGLVGESTTDSKPEDLDSDSDDGTASAPTSEVELSQVYSNMAACYLKQGRWDRALDAADKGLRADSRNVKAKFRRAQALRGQNNLYAARDYLQLTLDSLGNKRADAKVGFQAELNKVQAEIGIKEAKARNKWVGFLGKNPGALSVDDRTDAQAESS